MEQRIIYKAVKKEFRFTEDDKIFEKAKESGLSVADVIALMKVED